MDVAAQLLVNTLQIGAIYVLFALGLTMIFGVMRIVNFAHGEFFSLAALLTSVATLWFSSLGLPTWASYLIAFAMAVTAVLALSYITYQLAFKAFLGDMLGGFIVSLGLVMLLQGILFEIFGGAPRVVPNIVEGNLIFFGGTITRQKLIICILALLITVGLYQFLQRSRLGLALRAMAEDQEAALLQGINYRKIALYGFLIGSGLAAIAGCLIAPLTSIVPTMGGGYLMRAFMIVIIGGLGSIPGAIIGSFFIASIESIGGYFFDLSTATVTMFGLIAVLLLVRPQGLLGHVTK